MKIKSVTFIALVAAAANNFIGCNQPNQGNKITTRDKSVSSDVPTNASKVVQLDNGLKKKIDSLKKLLSQAAALESLGRDSSHSEVDKVQEQDSSQLSYKSMMDSAGTSESTEEMIDYVDKAESINTSIRHLFSQILTNPAIIDHDLNKLLKNNFLDINYSNDKKIWVFSWYDNMRGSAMLSEQVIHYRTLNNIPKIAENISLGSFGIKFYKLRSDNKFLYLVLGTDKGCNTCAYENATVIELTNKGINIDYSAFEANTNPDRDGYNGRKYSSKFVLGSREGDIRYFKFDEKSQVLKFAYLTDDLTPISIGTESKQIMIDRRLQFNGQRFVGNGYK